MYEVTKIFGGGTSWYYLIRRDMPSDRIVMAAHEDRTRDMDYLYRVRDLLNTTLTVHTVPNQEMEGACTN